MKATNAGKNLKRAMLMLGSLLASIAFFVSAEARAESTPIETALQQVRASVDEFVGIKDNDNLNQKIKDDKKFAAAKITLQKVFALGLLEVAALEKQLAASAIENLVAGDYTFDAADAHDTIANMLKYYRAYYSDNSKRAETLKNYNEAQRLAKDVKSWREKTFNHGAERILALNLVLRNKEIIKTANNRFNKIVADLRKLKNAKLISLETIDGPLNAAAGGTKAAEALDIEASAIAIKMLKQPPTAKVAENESGSPTDYGRVSNLVEQSFSKIKDVYKKFIEINELVKKLMNISPAP